MSQTKILLIDDDVSLLKLLSIRLTAADFIVETAHSGRHALGKLPLFQPHLIITDLRMEGMDGMALFEAVHARYPSLPVIILTAHGTIPEAVDATRKGVFSYLTKPFDSKQLLDNINAAQRYGYPPTQNDIGSTDQAWRSAIITASPLMEELLKQAWRVAQADVSTLIQSESGTGKELLARAIHAASPRAAGPFVAINCAAIPEALLESELFGHRKGAFTGADRNHTGLFEAANSGTLFLDEIGDMPLEFQAKLLRVLQEEEVRPVGMTQAVTLDVRIISATHTDLEEAIERRTFREDLYYRLNTVMLELPALAERCEDIPLLANHWLTRLKQRANSCIARSFSREAMELLMTAPWPGNVRQLLNVVEQVAVLATTEVISVNLVQKALRGKSKELLPLGEAQSQFERDYLVQILQMTRGNVCQAARLAHRNRTDFYKLLHRHQLEPALFRSD
ncbi:Transcriptional response regulatory protein GlrR [hydrothermal vent metagenome]|uniref:Transcriptional response regulatory protein GlrR n=1 Tax=hydrothermal vent metagenome TaxID=652676 RepID=A0A3B0ZUH9_9ZZZZ